MKCYQLKAAIKNQKPPVWRRFVAPAGITYSQLSLILTEVMEAKEEGNFGFEFYQRKIRFAESRESKLLPDFYYSVAEASEFYIDELLDTEGWFSFYFGEEMKLRVNIEKCLDKKGEDGIWPWIVKAVDVKSVDAEAMDGKPAGEDLEEEFQERLLRLNEKLEKKYVVQYKGPEYKTREEILELHRAGCFGLQGWREARNDPEKIKYSGNHYVKMTANILHKALLEPDKNEKFTQEEQEFIRKALEMREKRQGEKDTREQQEEEKEKNTEWQNQSVETMQKTAEPETAKGNRNRISLQERLLWETKEHLATCARRLGISGYSSWSKDKLAKRVSEKMLMPDAMKRFFIIQDEERIQAWEEAIAIGEYHEIKEEKMKLLEPFYEENYLALYEDNFAEIPWEVVEQYKKINTPEFQNRRRRASWMLDCLKLHTLIYGIAPVSVVMRMYRKKPGYRLKQVEFTDVFSDIPEEENPCILQGNKLIWKSLLENEAYIRLEESQEPWDFFVPEADEIEDCSRNSYPSKERHYREMKGFLERETGLREEKIIGILIRTWIWTTQGYDVQEMEKDLKKRGLVLKNKGKEKEFIALLEKVQEHTRLLRYRGNMPVQMKSSPQIYRF